MPRRVQDRRTSSQNGNAKGAEQSASAAPVICLAGGKELPDWNAEGGSNADERHERDVDGAALNLLKMFEVQVHALGGFFERPSPTSPKAAHRCAKGKRFRSEVP